MPTLLIATGRDRGACFEFDEAVTLGRAAENRVRLLDNQISRYHARVERDGDGWHVIDLGSRNGVRVGERRIRAASLVPGSSFLIGGVIVVFEPPSGLLVDAAGTGNLALMGRGAVKGEPVRHPCADTASTDPSETIDISALVGERGRLEAVLDVYGLIGRERDPEQLAVRLARRLREAVLADRVLVVSSPREEPRLLASDSGLFGGDTVLVELECIEAAVAGREGILARVDLPEADTVGLNLPAPSGRASVMVVPLVGRGRVVGAIYCDRLLDLAPPMPREARDSTAVEGAPAQVATCGPAWHGGVPFDAADVDLVGCFAAQAGDALEAAETHRSTLAANRALREQVRGALHIVGGSPAFRQAVERVRRVAATDTTVLLRGETGTGKEMLARLLHECSPRARGPFVTVNCAALVGTLEESELFGHERGAFTGADRQHRGYFEQAGGGTLFLDEIGDMQEGSQKKLLRVIEERRFMRVGGSRLVEVDVRIVAATNRDLETMVREGRFREDLFYRINVVPIPLPSLRERRDDIGPLAEHFLERFSRELGRRLDGLEPGARELLESYPWPGNVRELRNVIERAVVFATGERLGISELPEELKSGAGTEGGLLRIEPGELRLAEIVARVEVECITRALTASAGNKSEACRLLGISRPTLDRKLEAHGIDPHGGW